jgi:dihydrofolate reductase
MPWGRLGSVWPVVSRTFEPVGPSATRVEDDIEAVSRVLIARQVGEIEVVGPDSAASLTNLGLFDEYQFFLHPTVLGRGSPFFAGSQPPLRLVTSDLAGESVIRLTYIAASSRDRPTGGAGASGPLWLREMLASGSYQALN